MTGTDLARRDFLRLAAGGATWDDVLATGTRVAEAKVKAVSEKWREQGKI